MFHVSLRYPATFTRNMTIKTGSKLLELILLDTALKSWPKEFQYFPQAILQSNRNGWTSITSSSYVGKPRLPFIKSLTNLPAETTLFYMHYFVLLLSIMEQTLCVPHPSPLYWCALNAQWVLERKAYTHSFLWSLAVTDRTNSLPAPPAARLHPDPPGG